MAAKSVLSEIRSLLEKRPKFYPPKSIAGFSDEEMAIINKFENWFKLHEKDVEKVLSSYACIERKNLEEGNKKTEEDTIKLKPSTSEHKHHAVIEDEG